MLFSLKNKRDLSFSLKLISLFYCCSFKLLQKKEVRKLVLIDYKDANNCTNPLLFLYLMGFDAKMK